jgi:hypothetical protein
MALIRKQSAFTWKIILGGRLAAAWISPRRQGNQDHRGELLNTLEAPLVAVGGVERVADSAAVDILDV